MKNLVVMVAALAVGLVLTASASASTGPGSLSCPGLDDPAAKYDSAHYTVQQDQYYSCQIVNATDVADGSVVEIFIRDVGGGWLPGVYGTANAGTIAFSFHAPKSGCGTPAVAYWQHTHDSSNDWIDDGVLNGSGTVQAGFAYLDPDGKLIPCPPPTATYATGFTAHRTARGVVLHWTATRSPGVLGYLVLRGDGSRVNTHSSSRGTSFKLIDRRGSARYTLYARLVSGKLLLAGSVTTS